MTYDEWVVKVQREAFVPPVSRRPRVGAVADADAFIARMEARRRGRETRSRVRRESGTSALAGAA